MPQGKIKKAKLPVKIDKRKKQKLGAAFSRRANAPIQPKKDKFTEIKKIKQVISKRVNKSVEVELRSRASEGNINLSKAQQAVVKETTKVAASKT